MKYKWRSCQLQAPNQFALSQNMPRLLSIGAVQESVESHTIPTTQPPNQPTSTPNQQAQLSHPGIACTAVGSNFEGILDVPKRRRELSSMDVL